MQKRKFLLTFESTLSNPIVTGVILYQKTEVFVSGTGLPSVGIIDKVRVEINTGFNLGGLKVHATQLINSLEISTEETDDYKIVQ